MFWMCLFVILPDTGAFLELRNLISLDNCSWLFGDLNDVDVYFCCIVEVVYFFLVVLWSSVNVEGGL